MTREEFMATTNRFERYRLAEKTLRFYVYRWMENYVIASFVASLALPWLDAGPLRTSPQQCVARRRGRYPPPRKARDDEALAPTRRSIRGGRRVGAGRLVAQPTSLRVVLRVPLRASVLDAERA